MGRKAFSYIRFSTPEQALGRSYDRQREKCETYCQAQGLELATGTDYTFLDAGKSAYKGEHIGENGQLARFLRFVKDGTIERGSTLIVEALDRLGRQHVWHVLPWFMELVNSGVTVVTLKDGMVWAPGKVDEQELLLSIFAFSSSYRESDNKSMRLRDVFKSKRKAAETSLKPMGKVSPMWLRLKDDRSGYEEIPVYVNAVKRIFELTLAGYGKGRVAKMLNEEGHPTFKSKQTGKGWSVSSVQHVVKSRAVLGEWQPFTKTLDPEGKKREPIGKPILGYFPQIIEPSVFDRAQKEVEKRATSKSTKQTANFNVWSKVAKCIFCGNAMHVDNKGSGSKGRVYLGCSVGRNGVCTAQKLIRLDESERMFRLMLARLDSMALVKDSGKKLANELSAVEGRIVAQRTEHAELKALLRHKRTADLLDLVEEAAVELATSERERQRLVGELAVEDAIGFDTFMERLDLASHDGRNRANALLLRLEVVVYACQEGFIVSEKGRMRFGLASENVGTAKRRKPGRVGYVELNPWKRQKNDDLAHVAALKALKAAGPPHYVTPVQAGSLAYAIEEEADQVRYDNLAEEGHATEYP